MDLENGLVLLIVGPSGTGKGTLLSRIKQEHKEFVFSISATTRAPRVGETEGVHYFFKTQDEFAEMIKNDELFEWVSYCDNYYGTPKNFMNENISKGISIIIEVEVEGAINLKNSFSDSVTVFIMPPTFSDLKNRIEKRGTETDTTKMKRLKTALSEINVASKFDYIIVNDDIDDAIHKLNAIIVAEKSRSGRKKALVEELLKEGLYYERD